MYYGEFTYFCFISDGDLYTGTVADFSGMDPIIYREPLQTEQYDSMSLNGESQFSQVQYILCYAHEVLLLYRPKTAEMTATWRRTVLESVIDYGS